MIRETFAKRNYIYMFIVAGLGLFFSIRYFVYKKNIKDESILMNKFINGENQYKNYLKNKDSIYGVMVRLISWADNAKSYSQVYSQVYSQGTNEIHKFLNMRDCMAVVSKLNESDEYCEGWVMRNRSPWIKVLDWCNFLLLKKSPKEAVPYNNALLIADGGVENYKVVNMINSKKCDL